MADPYPLWMKKGTWEITANHPGANYQVKFTIPFYDGMKADFSDIRFSDSSDNALSYWIESYTSSTSAIVWVKLASTDTTGTLHYGNAAATDASDPDNVFEFFDGGETGSPSTDWTLVSGSMDYVTYSTTRAVTGTKSIKMDSATGSQGLDIKTPNITISNYIIELSFYDDGGTSLQQYVGLAGTSGSTKLGIWTGSSTTYYVRNLGSWAVTSIERSVGWHTIKYIVNSNLCDSYIDGTRVTDGGSVSGTQYLQLTSGWDTYLGTTYFDNVRIRKYISTDPTVTYTEAQESSNPPVANFTATPIYTVNFVDTSENTPTSWDWDFGDESTHGDTANPTHTYAEAGTYTVTLIATNEGGSDTYSTTVTVGGSGTNTVTIVRIHEMDHKAGTTQKHIVRVIASDGSGYLSSYTTATLTAYVDGTADAGNPQSWTISAYDDTIRGYWVTIPDTFSVVFGQNVNVIMSCYDGTATLIGEGELHLNVVSEAAGGGATAQQVWEYTTRTITEIPAGAATSAEITLLNNLSMSDIETACGSAITDAALPDAFLTAAIRSGRTVSQVLRIIEIMLDGSVTGLTSGSGSPVTFTGADGSTVAFTVDANGNRAISNVNLV